MIYLGLGSNLGNRKKNILSAVRRLHDTDGISVRQLSSLYETAPFGVTDQPDFLNAAARIETTLTPEQLLAACLGIEAELGRVRQTHWGPRTIDIDILAFNDVKCDSPALTLPHPGLPQRCFVLVPLAEIAGAVPVYDGLTPIELLALCPGAPVSLYAKTNWDGVCGDRK